MKQPGLDARRRDKDCTIGFAKGGNDHARLIDVLHELDDEISQLVRETPVIPMLAFGHGISGSTADVKAALMQR